MHHSVQLTGTLDLPVVERHGIDIVVYREVADVTEAGVRDGFARASKLAAGARSFLMVDLSRSGKPNDDAMAAIKQGIAALNPQFIGVFTGRGTLLNLLAGYAMATTLGRGRYQIFQTEAEAIAELRRRGARG